MQLSAMAGSDVAELSEEMDDEEAGETNLEQWEKVTSRNGKRKKKNK